MACSMVAVAARLRAAGCVYAEDEARLLAEAARDDTELASLVERRVGGEPVEQVVGWALFFGRRIALRPGVFVPRRRTEFVAAEAIALAPPAAVVLELCCGSGAVGVTVAGAVTAAEVHAVDLDPAAVACARQNLDHLHPARHRVYQGDLYGPLPSLLRGRVDVLVVNAPYVPTREIALMPAEARTHEPALALDGGPDGLDVLRRVAEGAARWLTSGGALLLETSRRQADQVRDALATHGLPSRVAHAGELEATVVIGTHPARVGLQTRDTVGHARVGGGPARPDRGPTPGAG